MVTCRRSPNAIILPPPRLVGHHLTSLCQLVNLGMVALFCWLCQQIDTTQTTRRGREDMCQPWWGTEEKWQPQQCWEVDKTARQHPDAARAARQASNSVSTEEYVRTRGSVEMQRHCAMTDNGRGSRAGCWEYIVQSMPVVDARGAMNEQRRNGFAGGMVFYGGDSGDSGDSGKMGGC